MSKYRKIFDYEGFKIDPDKETVCFACCDCGLVHSMGVAFEEGGKIGVAFKRENRATAQLRRHHYGSLHRGNGWKLTKEN